MNHIYDQPQFGEPWFNFPKLYSRMVRLFPSGSTFVEIGSWKGKSSAYMAVEIANSNKDIKFYCVDTWQGSQEHKDFDLSGLYETFICNMKPLEEYYFPLKISSVEASKKFKDNSLDFVFIDGSHEYEDVKQDILTWLPKVKDGGILAGHDFYLESHDYFPGVRKAVKETLGKVFSDETCFIYYKNKLGNFPTINCVTIEESEKRRQSLKSKFLNYGIVDINFHIFPRYKEGDCELVGSKVDWLNFHSKGPVTSHLKAVKNWYNNTKEDYTFFCEDDLSLETVRYWNFNWAEFFQKLPKDWEIVQLAWIREPNHFLDHGYKLRNRCWCDWSGCAYLITRGFAKKLIDAYYPNDIFLLEYQGNDADKRDWWALTPTIETIIYSNLGKVYSFPLFVEDTVECESTYAGNGQGYMHHDAHKIAINLWKSKLCHMSLDHLVPNFDTSELTVVQIGSNSGQDELSEYLHKHHKSLKFGLFVDANPIHAEKLKSCYQSYQNIAIETIAIKNFDDPSDTVTMYCHDNDQQQQVVSTNLDHVKKHEQYWGPGNIKVFISPAITLDKLLDKYNLKYIDWLLLDVEGMEDNLILNLDFTKYSIRKIEFEFVHMDQETLHLIITKLNSLGYKQTYSLDEKDMAFQRD